MSNTVITPLVSLVVKQYLDPLLGGVRVSSENPRPRPTPFVRLRPAGGNDRNMALSDRMLTVEVWDDTDLKAGRLAEQVFALLVAAPRSGHKVIRSVVSVGAPAQSPDPDDRSPRYRFTVQLVLRGSVA